MLAPPSCSGRRPALLNRSLTFEEERDRVQHHIVAAVAYRDDPRLVFKGGTMLSSLRSSRLPLAVVRTQASCDEATAPGRE